MSTILDLENPLTGKYKQPTGLFINNEFVESVDKQKIKCINPATEEEICSVFEATEADVDIAVKAARAAFDSKAEWRQMTPADRGKLMLKLADLIDQNAELLVGVEVWNGGKAINDARYDLGQISKCIRYYGGWADKIEGRTIDIKPGMVHYTRPEPMGVVAQIIPWNFPLLMLAWKIGPALATGNCIVMKTAEQTPMSALVLAQFVKEAGFPPGVFNLLSGIGKTAGAALSAHMDVDKIAFTGSTVVGRAIMKAAAESNLKKVTLELGGKSPNIVFDDANIDQAIFWANFGVNYNSGQTCCAGTRVFVQEGIYDKFVESLKKEAAKHAVGNPFDTKTFQGPQVSKVQFERILNYIETGKKEGASVLLGGARHGDKGYFIQPTIFGDVRPDMKIVREEIFGPVSVVTKFKDIDEVIRLGNDTDYGLAAAVHTTNINTAMKVSSALRAGTVWINCYNLLEASLPFGGYKQSGIGRELGEEALHNYTNTKSVAVMLQ